MLIWYFQEVHEFLIIFYARLFEPNKQNGGEMPQNGVKNGQTATL